MVDDFIINQIKEKTDIVDLIGQYVRLKKRGQNYLGLCPFHQEKTPSFTVSPAKNIWHCFGCSEGGNVYSFVMKIENIGFGEAIKLLAERSGVELSENDMKQVFSNSTSSQYKIVYEILKDANEYYKSNISDKRAQEYLKQRGLSPDIVSAFELGYSNADGTKLWQKLSQKYSEKDLTETGLFVQTSTAYVDRFKNRLMFPIIDLQKRVIAFGGRTLGNDSAKYINSPETKVYHKSDHLYGLNATKCHIRENDDCLILVEGYMDVVALYQAGVQNVAAILGTAFTNQQSKLVARFAKKCKLSFDSDGAGKKATVRSRDVFSDKAFEVRVVDLKDCKDPDDFISKYGKDAYLDQVNQAMMLLKFIIKTIIENYAPIDQAAGIAVEDKDRIIKDVHTLLSDATDIVINDYVNYIATVLKVEGDLVKSRLFPYRIFNMKQKRYSFKNNKVDKYTATEKEVLSILLNDLNLRLEYLDKFASEDFENQDYKNMLEYIKKHPKKTVHDFMLMDETDLVKKMVELSMIDYIEEQKKFLEEATQIFNKKTVENRLLFLNSEIKRLEKNGDSDKLNLLLNELMKLKKNQ